MDFEALTVQDLIELETNSGLTLPEVLKYADNLTPTSLPPAKVLAALMFIAGRLENPALTWDDALQRPLAQVAAAFTGSADPKDAPPLTPPPLT